MSFQSAPLASIVASFKAVPGVRQPADAGPIAPYQPVRAADAGLSAPGSRRITNKRAAHAAAREVLAQLERLHRVEFPAAERLVAPEPETPESSTFLVEAKKAALRGVSRLDRAARRSAKQEARGQAEAWAADELTLATLERNTEQHSLDAHWIALLGNNPAVVADAVAQAYTETEAPAQLVSIVDGVGFVRLLGPSEFDVPVFKPVQTRAGGASVATLSRSERAQWHRVLVAAQVLLAAKQTLAVAPGLAMVRILVMRPGVPEEPLLAVTIDRSRLALADFSLRAGQVLDAVGVDVVVKTRGGTGELQPIRIAADSAYGLFVR
jgi:hypothetical protein